MQVFVIIQTDSEDLADVEAVCDSPLLASQRCLEIAQEKRLDVLSDDPSLAEEDVVAVATHRFGQTGAEVAFAGNGGTLYTYRFFNAELETSVDL